MKSANNPPFAYQPRKPSRVARNVLAITVVLGMTLSAIPAAQAQFSVIHNFTAGGDGAIPWGGLTIDAGGHLYGTTSTGGFGGYGTVFKATLKNSTWVLVTLYSFKNGADGGTPTSGVIRDPSGLLYGTTYYGGTYGAGTVFQLKPPPKAGPLRPGNGSRHPFTASPEELMDLLRRWPGAL